MAQWNAFILFVVATTIAMVESRAIPAEPISVMLDPYGNPIVFLREKRTAVHPYPHRAMMFTGYYRPVRRTNSGGQATGVFAQGNAVSGEAFFGDMQSPHLKEGPEPPEEPEVSSAEAQAAPGPDETYNGEEDQTQVQDENGFEPADNQGQDEHHQQPQDEHHHEEEEGHRHDHHHHHHATTPEKQDPERVPVFTTEGSAATPVEEPVPISTEAPANRPKGGRGKNPKKRPVVIDEDDDDYEDEEPAVPFVPFKGNRRQNYPHLNNFFPMVFSFPGGHTRAGSSGSLPGTITAIANSYSTGKSGIANSVATAYGGPPNGKRRRTPTSEE